MKLKIAVTSDEVNEAIEAAIKNLYAPPLGTPPWFNSKKEAEDWAGDIVYDFVDDVLKALHIIQEDEDADF